MTVTVLSAGEGKELMERFVVYKLSGADTGGTFALVEHNVAPRALAAPVHTHADEDEYSYILEGEITAEVGDEVIRLTPGMLLSKPRGVPHAFWNSGDTPARLLEIISPAGFEHYFEELALMVSGGGPPDLDGIVSLGRKYGVEFDFDSIQRIAQQHGVSLSGAEPPPAGRGTLPQQ